MKKALQHLGLWTLVFSSCLQESPQANIYNGIIPEGMVLIPGGVLTMGGDNQQADPDELPKVQHKIESFFMDAEEVSNREFKAFVDATGYVTVAEKDIEWDEIKNELPPGISLPDLDLNAGSLVFNKDNSAISLNNPASWWNWTIGANWRQPEGPGSNIEDRMDHPVVHIAWLDAQAFAAHYNKRLPYEAEWEWAARAGIKNAIYPWGNEDIQKDSKFANYWQGLFPIENTVVDGYEATAPGASFYKNNYGLYDMAGNVWEWCQDWYHYDHYKQISNAPKSQTNIRGPQKSFDPDEPQVPKRVMRGGSFLCNDSYCSGYRNARRMKSSIQSAYNHTGFRCVKDLP